MTSMAEKELTHKPLKDEIYDALHRQIIAGKYAPGDWLRQEEIAGQMGVTDQFQGICGFHHVVNQRVRTARRRRQVRRGERRPC